MPALDEMRVLDMTQYEAGTSCTQILAWLGADVVKIERPGLGDPARAFSNGPHGPAYFLNYNSNKRSLALDLQSSEGRDLFLRLVPHFDVFMENYGPGVIERLEIDYDVVREHNPQIIYARTKGFGLSGPYAGYKCYDMIAQATGGAFSVTGAADGPPTRPGPTLADTGSGLQMALAITAAYVQRQRSGEGQFIELSMQEAVTLFMRTHVASGSDWGRKAAPRNGNRAAAPTDLYPCAAATPAAPSGESGPNDFVYIMVVTDRMLDTLCAAIDRPDLLLDPRFDTEEERHANADALHAEIATWTAARDKHEVMRILGGAGVPCGYTADTHDLWTDPHLQSRDFIQQVDHAELGPVELMRSPFRLSKSDVPLKAAPLLGEHTDEVLCQELGLPAAELARLREAGVVG